MEAVRETRRLQALLEGAAYIGEVFREQEEGEANVEASRVPKAVFLV